MKFGFLQSAKQFLKIRSLKMWVTLDQGQWMTLAFDNYKDSCTHLVDYIYQLWHHRLQQFLKNPLFYIFPYKSIGDRIWPCRKQGHCQPRVIIWTNLVLLENPMLHANFQCHQSFGFRVEDCLWFLLYVGMAAILVIWPRLFEQTFVPPSHGGSTQNFASIGLAVSKE